MTLRGKAIATGFAACTLILCSAYRFVNSPAMFVSAQEQAGSGAPVVKIKAPKNNASYSWNSLLNYSVVVTYQGKSTEFHEIPSNQVLLKTTYVPDAAAYAAQPATATPTPPGVVNIVNSTCLGCHQFRAKAMGPSFAAIGAQYSKSSGAADTLSEHIRAGSTGVWGQERMPAQAQLSDNQLHSIVQWILSDAANPDVNYSVGTEGTFRMTAPETPDAKGGVAITASYTPPDAVAHGEDTIVVSGR